MITSSPQLFDEGQRERPESCENECENENDRDGAENKKPLREVIRPNLPIIEIEKNSK
jgi:hypothetical protein